MKYIKQFESYSEEVKVEDIFDQMHIENIGNYIKVLGMTLNNYFNQQAIDIEDIEIIEVSPVDNQYELTANLHKDDYFSDDIRTKLDIIKQFEKLDFIDYVDIIDHRFILRFNDNITVELF